MLLINELHPVSIFPNSDGSLELSSSESGLLAGKGHEVSPEETETDGLSYALKPPTEVAQFIGASR